jgi:hypothetical protein
MKPNADQHKVPASNPVSKFSKHHYAGKGMKKILIAIDESKGSLKAVEQAGQQYGGTTDLHITLFHVLPNLPTTCGMTVMCSQKERWQIERRS